MDEAAANRLLAEAEEALTKHGFSVGQHARAHVGDSIDGGAAPLLQLGHGHTGRAADMLAALENFRLTAVPHTKDPAALGVVDWLQNAGWVEVRRIQES